MECGSQDALCQLANWFSQNDLLAPWLVEVLGRFGGRASGILGVVAGIARDYGQAIVGFIGVSFGFWRWWRYRERILHKRLADYLQESDARLAAVTSEVIELVQRPAPGQQLKDPLFVDSDLRVVLRERNWDKPAYALGVAASSDWHLDKAIRNLGRRLETANAMVSAIQRQLASAYTIRGAIAASSAKGSKSEQMNSLALIYFRSALALPTHEKDITTLELEAHQLRKLGLSLAGDAYAKLFTLAASEPCKRRRMLSQARARRYLSEVLRSNGRLAALQMMRTDNDGSAAALTLIAACEPLSFWERLEKADMHYYTASGASELSFVGIESTQLENADTEYRRIVTELGRGRWLRPRKFRKLRKRALEGLERVAHARDGVYDLGWLS